MLFVFNRTKLAFYWQCSILNVCHKCLYNFLWRGIFWTISKKPNSISCSRDLIKGLSHTELLSILWSVWPGLTLDLGEPVQPDVWKGPWQPLNQTFGLNLKQLSLWRKRYLNQKSKSSIWPKWHSNLIDFLSHNPGEGGERTSIAKLTITDHQWNKDDLFREFSSEK